jgi:lysyl-tRNA synthetase class 2
MIEWYRRNATYEDIADDLVALFETLAPDAGAATRITVREAYLRYAGWDPWTDWNQDRFDFDMATKIEPSLPKGPVFLMDYPREACSLAKLRGDVAERWEFYWDGVELANCFTELCDGDEQRRRFEAARKERRELGEADYPLDEEFLSELPQIGSAAGVALGVDRLVMLLCGAKSIADVMY